MPVEEILAALVIAALAADSKAAIERLSTVISEAIRRLGEHKRE